MRSGAGALAGNILPAGKGMGTAMAQEKREAEPGTAEIIWHDVRTEDWGVEGKGWAQTEEFYDRLPAKAKGVVREAVWGLSRHSAGLCADFETDATAIHARWTLRSENLAMAHMPATGVSGLDLYGADDRGRLTWLGVGIPKAKETETKLAEGMTARQRRHYRVYLPLYNGVLAVAVGVPKGAFFRPVPPRTSRPLIFYGTSITQGGCASRPGMAHPAILGRRLDVPVINLGFSGNGWMDPEVAEMLAELDPCAYVIDCLPNMSAELVAGRAEPLVRTLRRARPDTPVVLVEDRTFTSAPLLPGHRQNHSKRRAALKQAFTRLEGDGMKNLHYVPGEHLLGDDGESTVDGSHPTDLGFMRMADALEPVLRPLCRQRRPGGL